MMRCPCCQETIRCAGPIHTPGNGADNYVMGECGCGTVWSDKFPFRGSWIQIRKNA